MKISIPRSFDTGTILKAFQKAGVDGVEDFILYFQEFATQVVNGIRGTLTIEENLNSDVRVLDLTHDVSTVIRLDDRQLKKTPKHVFLTKAIPFANAATAFNWQMTQNGELEVKASFAGTPASAVQVTMVILF